MGSSSSAKKVAKIAQKGRTKKVRFQGGSVFPIAVALTTILGIALIAYARGSSYSIGPGPKASEGDSYLIAFGIDKCGEWLPNIAGTLEDSGAATDRYLATGVNSLDDGIIHYHPYSDDVSGKNAKLVQYLKNYDIELTDSKLVIPDSQPFAQTIEEGVTKCTVDGKEVDGELRVALWKDATAVDKYTLLASKMDQARVTDNGMAMAIYYLPKDTESYPQPPSVADLATLLAGGSTTTTVAGATDSTVAGSDTTVAGSDTTVAGSDTTTAATDTSAPATSDATASSAAATTTTSG